MHERVHVAVRIRPFIESDLPTSELCTEVDESKSHVTVNDERVFAVDRVFGLNDDTEMLFDSLVCPLLDDFANGFNATIMAYGQTGTGKTYTINGFIPHVLEYLIRIKFGGSTTQLSFQYVEVYGETIRDLLVANPEATAASLQVVDAATYEQYLEQQVNNATDNRERINKIKMGIENKFDGNVGDVDPDVMSYAAGTFLLGATRARANSLEEVMQMYQYGTSMRATGYTDMSAHSSRSHSIFTIFNHRANENTVRCKLNLVDLAGSERNKKTHNVGVRFQESIGINSGLLALGKVIRALSQNHTRFRTAAVTNKNQKCTTDVNEKIVGDSYLYFVPYRSSKLTRILQDALGGNSKTLFIACVAPDQYNSDETIRTLQYCALARKVINIPERCQERLYGSPSRSRNPSRGRTRHPSPAQVNLDNKIECNNENDEFNNNNNNDNDISERNKEKKAFDTLQREYNILQSKHVELQSHFRAEHDHVVQLQTELSTTQRKLHICTEELKEDREVFALQLREVEKLVATNDTLQATIRTMERNTEQMQHLHTSIGVMTESNKTDAQVQTNEFSTCNESSSQRMSRDSDYINHYGSEVTEEVHPTNETNNIDINLTSSKPIEGDGDKKKINKNVNTLKEHIMPTHEITALAEKVMEYQVSNNELRQRLSAVVSLLDNQQRENALLKLELNEALRAIMPQYTHNHLN